MIFLIRLRVKFFTDFYIFESKTPAIVQNKNSNKKIFLGVSNIPLQLRTPEN